MKSVGYKLLTWLLGGLARLPLGVLYLLADFIFFLLYYVIRYRRLTVAENIRLSFPEKSERECRVIGRQFYRNFADMIVETIKLNHISDEEIKRRMTFEGIEIIDDLLARGRNITAYFSHC
ncbi:MAG: acetyltransferase, partial [Muribaculaceae bacterium]|nr:acetyltransferase [Muribaculaceae bacterium]